MGPREKKTDVAVKEFLNELELVAPLTSRDAFFWTKDWGGILLRLSDGKFT